MKRVSWTLALLALGLAAGTAHTIAQSASVQSELVKDWTNQKDLMTKIADAMPEDKFSYKSTPAQRSYGEQILHIAGANVGLFKTLGGKAEAPTINAKATSKAEIMKALTDSYDYGLAVLKEQTDQTMLQAVQGPRFLGSSTRARIASFAMSHAMDIYGQMAVYLRLNGIVPPASRNSM